jgi:hydroxymethylbilane synthase
MPITLGTRNSKLAMIQANSVKTLLESKGYEVNIKVFTSKGDANTALPLYRMSSTGVFVDELNERILSGEIDLAVHSAKDIPSTMQNGLEISAVLKRDDYRDTLISAVPLEDMKEDDIIGTSSMRRIRQARTVNGKMHVADIRGNIDTRVSRYLQRKYTGIIIAIAAYNRMSLALDHYILSENQFLPAPNQGIIALVGKVSSKPSEISRSINHADTYKNMENERFIARSLNLGCSMPVGILSKGGEIKTRFYSLKSETYRDLNFHGPDLEAMVGKIKLEISDYGYF